MHTNTKLRIHKIVSKLKYYPKKRFCEFLSVINILCLFVFEFKLQIFCVCVMDGKSSGRCEVAATDFAFAALSSFLT